LWYAVALEGRSPSVQNYCGTMQGVERLLVRISMSVIFQHVSVLMLGGMNEYHY